MPLWVVFDRWRGLHIEASFNPAHRGRCERSQSVRTPRPVPSGIQQGLRGLQAVLAILRMAI
jgi:hypothetical protein